MIFSSRNLPHIAHNLSSSSLKFTKINLDANDFVKKNVEAFIRYRVNELGWDTKLKKRVKNALLVKSEGTFF